MYYGLYASAKIYFLNFFVKCYNKCNEKILHLVFVTKKIVIALCETGVITLFLMKNFNETLLCNFYLVSLKPSIDCRNYNWTRVRVTTTFNKNFVW